jgi:hypothetical protein
LSLKIEPICRGKKILDILWIQNHTFLLGWISFPGVQQQATNNPSDVGKKTLLTSRWAVVEILEIRTCGGNILFFSCFS